MPRVLGIDPGTISIDLCGLDEGALFLDRSVPTAEALADPAGFVRLLQSAAPFDLIAGPSGYGLPLVMAADLTDADVRLASLAPDGEGGGIGGFRALLRALAESGLPVVFTPGVVHLASVPAHRKVNRIDMGTADKVCAAALALHEAAARERRPARELSCILLELGGAFTSAIAIEAGAIVDGLGGTSGPLGVRAAGALDGEVALLAGPITKSWLFDGGVAAISGMPDASLEALSTEDATPVRVAWDAYVEGCVKAVATLAVAVPAARQLLVSGRVATVEQLVARVGRGVQRVLPHMSMRRLEGFAHVAKHAAQGAALLADGLAGGRHAPLVDALGLRAASGTVLDHLHVIDAAAARRRLGLP